MLYPADDPLVVNERRIEVASDPAHQDTDPLAEARRNAALLANSEWFTPLGHQGGEVPFAFVNRFGRPYSKQDIESARSAS